MPPSIRQDRILPYGCGTRWRERGGCALCSRGEGRFFLFSNLFLPFLSYNIYAPDARNPSPKEVTPCPVEAQRTNI